MIATITRLVPPRTTRAARTGAGRSAAASWPRVTGWPGPSAPGDRRAATQPGKAAPRQDGDHQGGGREGGHRDQVEAGQPGQPERLGQPARRDQQGRTGDRAERGREQDRSQRPAPGLGPADVGRRIARQEDGRVGPAEQQAAGEHEREAGQHRRGDHGQRPEHADGVPGGQAGAAPGPGGQAGHQQRGRRLAGGQGAEGEAGGGVAAGEIDGQQRGRGPTGGQAEAADGGGGGQQRQGRPRPLDREDRGDGVGT